MQCANLRFGKVVPKAADTAKINWFMAQIILVIMVIHAAMVYGPVAAFLVELFPTRRQSSALFLMTSLRLESWR